MVKEGKGTIRLNSFEELNEVAEKFQGKLVSPGGAAGELGVSRAYIHQLEKDGVIRAYRIQIEESYYDDLPFILRIFIDKKRRGDYIYIPIEDLDEIKQRLERRREEERAPEIEKKAKLIEEFEKKYGDLEGLSKEEKEVLLKLKKEIELNRRVRTKREK